MIFDNLLDELLEELLAEHLDEEQVRTKPPEFLSTTKRRKIKGRELIETFNELEGSPPAPHFSINVSKKSLEEKPQSKRKLSRPHQPKPLTL